MKKEEITPGERTQLRAVLGGINWVQREKRPDQAGNASIGMSRTLKATVQYLCDANTSVAQLKADPFLGIIIPSIALHRVRWATIQDASIGNAKENKSQAGYLVGGTTQELWKNLPAPFALISYKSHSLKRVIDSTLAAETLSMSEALAEVEWIRGLFEELSNPQFCITEWESRSRSRGLLCKSNTRAQL